MTNACDVVVGVDAGASRSRACVMDPHGVPLARGEAEAAASVDEAAGGIATLVSSTLAAIRCNGPARALCCGMAGAGKPAVRARVGEELRARGVADHVHVVTDAEAAYHDAFGTGPGILLIAGTGSVAWARSPDGTTHRVGGRGPLLGDEGSGFAIARAGLAAAVRGADGRAQATALLDCALRFAGAGDVRDLTAWAEGATRAAIARFAPDVIEAGARGDDVANAILDDAIRHLLQHVRALLPAFGDADARLALAGGLLETGGPLRPAFIRALRSAGLPVHLADLAVDGARGAARLALIRGSGG